MELDDLKNDWQSATDQTNIKSILTSKTINQMTQKKYRSKMKKIKYPELAGSIICLLAAGFTVFNFNKLDTVFLKVTGVTTIVLLLMLPAVSFFSLKKFGMTSDANKPYVETMKHFAFQKLRFQKYQLFNAFFSYVLLVTIIILLPKFFYQKNITYSKSFWMYAFSFGYIFLIFFSRWVKKFYSNSLNQAQELLKEINS